MKKNYFVYKFVDRDNNTLYVGSTKSLNNRIKHQHFSKNRHIPNECLEKVESIFFSICDNSDDMKIKERYLINVLKPKYNRALNNSNSFSFEISIEWQEYHFNKNDIHRNSYVDQFYNIKKHKNYNAPSNSKIVKIKSARDLLLLDTCPRNREKTSLIRGHGGSCWYDFYFIKINNRLYLFCSEIDKKLGYEKDVSGKEKLLEYDYEKIIDEFGYENYYIIKNNSGYEDLSIFQKLRQEIMSEDDPIHLNSRDKVFIDYEKIRKTDLIEKTWINAIDKCLINLKEYLNGDYDWINKYH